MGEAGPELGLFLLYRAVRDFDCGRGIRPRRLPSNCGPSLSLLKVASFCSKSQQNSQDLVVRCGFESLFAALKTARIEIVSTCP